MDLPYYHSDLRRLVNRALGDPGPVPGVTLPTGSFGERLAALPDGPSPAFVSTIGIGSSGEASDIRHVDPTRYWTLALAHRVFALGPLLDIAQADMSAAERLEVEDHVLRLFNRDRAVPLSHDVLIGVRNAVGPIRAMAIQWFDEMADDLMSAPSVEEAAVRRTARRVDVVRRAATRGWPERAAAVAEVMVDIVLLDRAIRSDVERAHAARDAFGGSVTLALQSLDDAHDTAFERVLGTLGRSAPVVDQVGLEEQALLRKFVMGRYPYWRFGVLFPGERAAPPIDRKVSKRQPKKSHGEGTTPRSESALETYGRLRDRLNRSILGRPSFVRALALAGTAAIHRAGRPSLLITGPSGSGKTHSVRCLAEAMGQSYKYVPIAIPDIAAPGWRGGQLNDVLDSHADQADSRILRGILHLDEIDKARIDRNSRSDGSLEWQTARQSALLQLLDGHAITPDSGGRQVDTSGLLVIGTGAFDGRFSDRPPTTQELVDWGYMLELAARWGERLCLTPPSREEAIELLRSSDRSVEVGLGRLVTALGLRIEVPDAVLAYVADSWLRVGSDLRSASEWLLAAARRRLINALEEGATETIVLAPDDVVPPRR